VDQNRIQNENSRRFLVSFLVVACALFTISPAHAHNRSRGQTEFSIEGSVLSVEITLSPEDILDLLFVDLRSEAEQKALERGLLQNAISKNMRRWVKIASSSQEDEKNAQFATCVLNFDEIIRDPKREVFTLRSHAQCQAPIVFLRIDWGMSSSATLNLAHMGTLLKKESDDPLPKTLHNFVLSKRENRHIFRVQQRSTFASFKSFFILGAEHIALGYDHLAFLLALLLACGAYKRLLLVVSTFTLAHSFTLALAALDIFRLPASIIEPAIALSIALAALFGLWRASQNPGAESQTLWKNTLKGAIALAFFFGLLHGMGFATLLRESFADSSRVLVPLVAFNLGIECVQMLLASLFFFLLSACVILLKKMAPKMVPILPKLLYVFLLVAGFVMFFSRLPAL